MSLKRILVFLIIFILVIFNTINIFSQSNNDVYVIPIKGQIDKATYQFLQREISKLESLNPKAIIFEIDTYGGFIIEAEKIKNLMIDIEPQTISFVNTKAESAGVLLTISSDKIVMAEGATIGSAEPIPNTEKNLSYWVSELRSTAIRQGRDEDIIASMADKSISIDNIIDKGKLLNLNYKEAKELNISDLTANSYEEILDNFNIDYQNIKEIELDFITRIAKFLVNPYILTLLIIVGLLGFVFEIFTLGFGVGGTISILAFSLYFGGNLLIGNTGWAALIIFITGVILLVIEAFVPGFGIPGIAGIAGIITGIILASPNIEVAIIAIVIGIIANIVTAFLFIKYGQRSPYFDKIILSTKQEENSSYTTGMKKERYLEKSGYALTTLRPSGTVIIDDDRLDAVTEGEFIMKGEKVKVVKIEGLKVIVRKIEK